MCAGARIRLFVYAVHALHPKHSNKFRLINTRSWITQTHIRSHTLMHSHAEISSLTKNTKNNKNEYRTDPSNSPDTYILHTMLYGRGKISLHIGGENTAQHGWHTIVQKCVVYHQIVSLLMCTRNACVAHSSSLYPPYTHIQITSKTWTTRTRRTMNPPTERKFGCSWVFLDPSASSYESQFSRPLIFIEKLYKIKYKKISWKLTVFGGSVRLWINKLNKFYWKSWSAIRM